MGNSSTKPSNYKRFLAAANGYLERKKLEDAERNFANALKLIHKHETKQYETAVALRGLGYVYKERGIINENGQDLVKASGLFNSALTRLQRCAKDEKSPNKDDALLEAEIAQLKEEIPSTHALFTSKILGTQPESLTKDYQKVEHYQENLKHIRDFCQTKIRAIDKLPPLDPDKRNVIVEQERGELIQHVYAEVAIAMREFVSNMVNDCVEIMFGPPCRYSILGLGSTAREEATPYSDLEFCILVEENTEYVLQYFINLTNFLHLKVVELGETILPSLGIQSLNNYYSGNSEDDWFFDSGPRGFSLDGAMPWASKVPTGREMTVNKPWVLSLIKTPQEMASLLSETSIRKEGYRLADVLSTCALISGDQSLFGEYNHYKREFSCVDNGITSLNACGEVSHECNEKISLCGKQRILQELVEVEKQHHTSLANYIRRSGGSYTVKKDFYRFPSLVVEYLGQFYNIESSSSWATIDRLESGKFISSDGAHNLRVALAIAAELRLKAYLQNKSQHEYFNDVLALLARKDIPKDLAMLLERFFLTVVPLEIAIKKVTETGNLLHLRDCKLYDNNPKIKAQMYCQFKQYYKAAEILQGVVAEKLHTSSTNENTNRELAEVSKILGNALFFLENGSEAFKYYGIALNINEKLYESNPELCNLRGLGDSYLNYGACLCALGEGKKALPYLARASEIRQFLLERSSTALEKVTRLQDVVDAKSNLSKVYSSSSLPSDELSLFFHHNKQAVTICEVLLQEYNVFCSYYPSLYFHQGLMYYDLKRFPESANAYEKALELFYKHKKYDLKTANEASLLNNFGNTLIELGNFDKARYLHTRAYEIRKQIHGGDDHNSLARSLNNFGLISEKEGNVREAYQFYIQARDMSERIHGADSSFGHLQMYRRNVRRCAEKLRL